MEKLIIDTDFETDCDDAGALAILHGLPIAVWSSRSELSQA